MTQVFQERCRKWTAQLFLQIDTEADNTRGTGNLFQYFMTATENVPLLRRKRLTFIGKVAKGDSQSIPSNCAYTLPAYSSITLSGPLLWACKIHGPFSANLINTQIILCPNLPTLPTCVHSHDSCHIAKNYKTRHFTLGKIVNLL